MACDGKVSRYIIDVPCNYFMSNRACDPLAAESRPILSAGFQYPAWNHVPEAPIQPLTSAYS